MKELSLDKKIRVIKLLLHGDSYAEISQRESIAQGSVVNIVNEFREGEIPVPADMTEYIDELRSLVVDFKRNNTGVAEMKSYLKLHTKLNKLGASSEEAEKWILTCRSLAKPGLAANQLIKAATELTNLSSDTGLTYRELIGEYQARANELEELNKQSAKARSLISELQIEFNKEKNKCMSELNSIRKAMATAQDCFEKQKYDLKSRLDDYLTSHSLSMKNIDTVMALLETNLDEAGLKKIERDKLADHIREAGSFAILTKRLNQSKTRLQNEVDKLKQRKQEYSSRVNELSTIESNLSNSINENKIKLERVNGEIESREAKLSRLEETINQNIKNVYITRLIIDFLFSPKNLRDYDIDRLVNLMIGLRQSRLGIGPGQVTDSNGKVVCECQVPKITSTFNMSEIAINNVRYEFAHLLTPLVQDKFVSRFDYDLAETKHIMDKGVSVLDAKLDGIMQERKRHLF